VVSLTGAGAESLANVGTSQDQVLSEGRAASRGIVT